LERIWKDASAIIEYSGISLDGLRGKTEKPVRIANVSPEIQNEYVPKTCPVRHRYANPLGSKKLNQVHGEVIS
jgi:hypothetical protein